MCAVVVNIVMKDAIKICVFMKNVFIWYIEMSDEKGELLFSRNNNEDMLTNTSLFT